MQGCGTTRGPIALPAAPPMPPVVAESQAAAPAVRPVQPYRPATIEEAVASAVHEVPVAATPEAPAAQAHRTYVVGKGDSLSVIAKRFDVSMAELMVLNNIRNPDVIRFGQKLKLPSSAAENPSPVAAVTRPALVVPAGNEVYEVKPGDSLSVIAQRHGTTVKALQDINRLTGDRILVGQKLALPAGAQPVAPRAAVVPSFAPVDMQPVERPLPRATVDRPVLPEPSDFSVQALAPEPPPPAVSSRQTYTVQARDNILTVASQHNVSIAELRRVNQLTSDALIPGQTLIIPSAE